MQVLFTAVSWFPVPLVSQVAWSVVTTANKTRTIVHFRIVNGIHWRNLAAEGMCVNNTDSNSHRDTF